MNIDNVPLFANTSINTDDILIKQYPANTTIELEGSKSTYLGIILRGSIQIVTYTVQGTPILISTLAEGMEFGDVLIYGSRQHSFPGSLITLEPTSIAVIPHSRVEEYIQFDPVFRRNFLSILSDKVYVGTMTSKLLSQDTIRDKILFFLSQERKRQKSRIIVLDQTKEQLAKRLHVTRPSLSRELIQMKKDNLIDYDRYSITIKNDE